MDPLMTEDDHHGIKSFVQKLRRGSKGFNRRPDSPDTDGLSPLRRNSSPKGQSFYCKAAGGTSGTKKSHLVGDLSLSLWNSAYDSLRDSPTTGAMVVAYESIISQELPVHLRSGGMTTSFRNRPDEERLALLTVITKSGLEKRRGSKTSQVEEVSRTIIDECKGAIGLELAEERATAVAWAGLCTLTPLLLDPILRLEALRTGLFHVTGRIGWYMALPHLLLRDSWKQGTDFDHLADSTRDRISRIVRKALEFEMNVICATASTWNAQAKNTVRWPNLPNLVAELLEMDEELAEHIDAYASETVAAEFARRYHDFVEPPADATTQEQNHQEAVRA